MLKKGEKALVRVMSTQTMQTVVSINSRCVRGVLVRLEMQHFFNRVICYPVSM